jgi:CDP-glucose 4,6-dehydratase
LHAFNKNIQLKIIMSFNNLFQDKKVIVTGHTGFKGAWLTAWLLRLGAKVTGISKDIPTDPALFEECGMDKKITHHIANICDLATMKRIFSETAPDFVFHLAAQPIVSVSYADPIDTLQTNMMGTANILEAMRVFTHPCVAVMITSDKCYDNVEWIWGYREHDAVGGKDPYSASKGGAELVIKTYFHSFFNKPESTVKLASVRAGNVIGGGDWALNRIVPDCIRAWSRNETVKIRSPHATRPWQHVLEPLSGYLRTAQALHATPAHIHGEAFNFGPNADQNHTVLELLEAISGHWSFNGDYDKFAIENNTSFHEAGLLKLNCDKALAMLQWKPVLNFEETARFTGAWYSQYYQHGGAAGIDAFTVAQIEEFEQKAIQKNIAWAL